MIFAIAKANIAYPFWVCGVEHKKCPHPGREQSFLLAKAVEKSLDLIAHLGQLVVNKSGTLGCRGETPGWGHSPHTPWFYFQTLFVKAVLRS